MNKRTIVAFISICFITLLTYQAFEGYRFLTGKPQLVKHIFNIGFLLAVAAIGYYSLNRFPEKWIVKIWTFLYLAVIAFLLLFGVIDVLFHLQIQNVRNMLSGIKMFFCSPLPFLLLIFLSKFSEVKPGNDGKL
jgi:hypothetical protein